MTMDRCKPDKLSAFGTSTDVHVITIAEPIKLKKIANTTLAAMQRDSSPIELLKSLVSYGHALKTE